VLLLNAEVRRAARTARVKERILEFIERRPSSRRDELRHRLAALETDMRRESDPLIADWAEQSAQRAKDDVRAGIRARSESELREVESALRRLAGGTYGTCRECGEPIVPGRLYSLPHIGQSAP